MNESATASTVWIALLRGVGPGIRPLPMAELRAVGNALGWSGVQTVLQTGNLVFRAAGAPAALEAQLESAILARFGFEVPAVVRSGETWAAYVRSNPLREVAEPEPDRVLIVLAKSPMPRNAEELLRTRVADGERVARAGDALWIYYPNGVSRSKLVPGALDRLIGVSVTTRNWRTVLRLHALADPHGR